MNICRHMAERREITVGFTLMFVCFPLTEWGNWMWRRTPSGVCIGPMRISLKRETAVR